MKLQQNAFGRNKNIQNNPIILKVSEKNIFCFGINQFFSSNYKFEVNTSIISNFFKEIICCIKEYQWHSKEQQKHQ